MDKKWILAAGGGGGSREPVRTPDNLLSQDYFEIVLALCEGPIKGLVSSGNGTLENFYAGDTAAFNLGTNKPNFSDFNVTAYVGGDDNVPLKLRLGGLAANIPVSVALSKDIPVTRTTPALQRGLFDQIEVRINFAYLAKQNNDGIFEATAQFRIEYKATNSGTWLHFENRNPINITGKTTNGYVKDFIFQVPKIPHDYDIRVTKLSPDGVQGVDETVVVLAWESYQTVVRSEPVFPGLAMMHLYGKASNQFSSLPDFSGVYEGMLVKVPVNYNPVARTYDESTPWNGTFKEAYTNNGPWILYNLITNPKYGLARYYKGVTANRYEFYEEAKWCDTMVPDGRGGTQPRFTFNELLADASPGMELLRYVAGSFDAVIYDDGNGVISLRSDRPATPTQVFTPENVSVEGFAYTFTEIPSRFNDITAVFVNPDLDWQEDRRSATIDNTAVIAQNGRIPFEFIAVGCTDSNEAVRRANLRYVTSNGEVTTVSFVTSRFGLLCELLKPILVCDPDADWGVSGRIKSVVGNTIHLRDPIYFADSNPRTMRVQSYTGLVDITVSPPATGEVYTLTITAGSFPSASVPDRTTFIIEDQTALGMPKPFRVLSIEEVEGKPDKVQITALEVEENKYTVAESGTVYSPSSYAYTPPGEPTLPTSFLLTSPPPIINSDGSLLYRIEASWKRPIGANTARYEIDFKHDDDDVWRTEVVYGERAFLSPVKDGEPYTARLYAVSPVGVRSALCLQSQITVLKKSGTLAALTGLTVAMTNTGWEIRWTAPTGIPDFDLVDIRIGTSANTFDALPVAFRKKESPQQIPWRAAGSYRVFAKIRDSSGNVSATAATADFTVLIPATPTLTISRGFDGAQIAFQDCTTTQPLKDILIRTGTAGAIWDTASDSGAAGANQRLVTVVPSATSVTRVFLRARDIANNLSNIAAADIPAAAGNVQELLDLLENGIGESALSPSLLSTIQLINAPSTTPGSVNQRVAAEATQRTQAIQTETNDRIQAIALSEQNLTAAINLGDTNVWAAVQNYAYSKASSDAAIANSINALNASITGPAGPIASAVSQEAGVRAAADGHLGAQWALKVALINAGGTAEIAGIAVAGTSSGTAGSRFDMSFRSNAFYFLPPAGQSNVGYSPLIFYPSNTVVNGVNVAAGLYTRAAFIEYIQADRIDTRGLTVRTLGGTVLLGDSVNLDFSRINPSFGWLNSSITVANGALSGIGTAGVLVDNRYTSADANALSDPVFAKTASGAAGHFSPGTGWSITAVDGEGGTAAAVGTAAGQVRDLYTTAYFPSEAGETWFIRARIWVSSSYTNGGGLSLGVETRNAALVNLSSWPTFNVNTAASGGIARDTWVTVQGNVTVSSPTAAFLRAFISIRDTAAAGTLKVSSWYVGKVAYGATVGAPAGTLVNGVAAETLTAQASTAASNATQALNALTDIGSDSQLTPGEKQQVKRERDSLAAEKVQIDAQAAALSVSPVTFGAAFVAFTSYVDPLIADLGTTTAIVPATFRGSFATYFAARQTILNAIAAKAATTANWSGVSGSGRPADNASADIRLVPFGPWMTVAGNTITRTQTLGTWDGECYSVYGYRGGAFVSASPGQLDQGIMFGLNVDPLTNSSYTSLDHAFYLHPSGICEIWEDGLAVSAHGAYLTTDVFSVLYDGSSVSYIRNGTVLRTVAKAGGILYYFDSSFLGGSLNNVRFGPLSSNNWAAVGGTGKPQDNATVGAPAGTMVGSIPAENVESTAGAQARADAALVLARRNRPNLLANGGFEYGLSGLNNPSGLVLVNDSVWGKRILSTTIPSGTHVVSWPAIPAVVGAEYTVHGDALLLASAGMAYFDIVFLDAGGGVVAGGDGPQNPKAPPFDFSADDTTRTATAVSAVCPAGATQMAARFVVEGIAGATAFGCRLVKLERGGLPHSAYTSESAQWAQAATLAQAQADLTGKLNKGAADVLTGPISIQSSGAIVVGSGDTGVFLTPTGIVAMLGGDVRLAYSIATGALAVKGDISGSTGNFVGSVSVNGATWANTVPGFFAGIDAGHAVMRIGSATQYLRYSSATGNLELKLDTFTANFSPASVEYYSGSSGAGVRDEVVTVTPVGGVAPYTYLWTVTLDQSFGGALSLLSSSGNSATFRGSWTSSTGGAFGRGLCIITDSLGRQQTATVSLQFSGIFGP